MESFFASCFRNKCIERTLLNFCISVVNSEFARKNQSTTVLKILRLEGGSFPISIPLNLFAVDWVFKKFFKTERAILLDYHIWLKDKRRSSVLFSVRLASGIKRVWMGLWQLTNGQNFNWQLTFHWVLLTTDEGPDCPLFSKKNRFKALNSIVPLFSSDNVIKCASFGGNLSSKTFKCHSSLMIYCNNLVMLPSVVKMTYDLKFTLLWDRASIRWLLMRALQKQLQVFSEMIQILSFFRSTSQ